MGIPIAIFYFIYLALVFVFIILSLFNVFHLVRYGVGFSKNFIAAFYIIMTILIMLISWEFSSRIDWNKQIPLQFEFNSQGIENLEI